MFPFYSQTLTITLLRQRVVGKALLAASRGARGGRQTLTTIGHFTHYTHTHTHQHADTINK